MIMIRTSSMPWVVHCSWLSKAQFYLPLWSSVPSIVLLPLLPSSSILNSSESSRVASVLIFFLFIFYCYHQNKCNLPLRKYSHQTTESQHLGTGLLGVGWYSQGVEGLNAPEESWNSEVQKGKEFVLISLIWMHWMGYSGTQRTFMGLHGYGLA